MRNQQLAIILALALVAITATCVGASTTGIISGVITDTQNGKPLSGANVIISGTTLTTVTNAEGKFVITNVPPGEYEVQVEMIGYATQTSSVSVTMDIDSVVNTALAQEATQEETVVVTRPRPMIVPDVPTTLNTFTSQQESFTRTDPGNIRAACGALSALPGVLVETDGSGQMHVRGGRPDQTGWYLEGIPLTDPNTGTFGTNLYTTAMNKFQVYSGGFGAEYGNAISGVLNEVKKTGADSPGMRMNIEGGGGAYSDAFAEFGGGTQDSFNYYVSTAMQRSDLDAPIVKNQEYFDTVTKLVWPSKNNKVTVLALRGSLLGKMAKYHDTGDNNDPTPHEKDFMRQNYTVGAVTWSHNFSPESFITVQPYYMFTGILSNGMGASNPLSGAQYINASSHRKGLQANYTSQLGDHHLLKIGSSMMKSDNDYYLFVGMPLFNSNVNTTQKDAYLEDKIKLSDKLTSTAGVRYESMKYDRVGAAYVDLAGYTGADLGSVSVSTTSPRLGLAYSANDRTAYKLSWGKYTKFVPSSSAQMVYTFPDMGMVDPAAAPGPANPTLEQVMPGLGDTSPQRNTNLEFSAERQLNDSTLVRVTPFITKSTNLGDYYTDPTTFITRYENVGKGETKGVEVFLRKKMSDNWQGWLSYTNQAAKATKANLGLVTSMYNTNWDQRHTLSLVSNYKGGKFGHTVRADIGSGRADIDAPSFTGRANPSCIMSYGLTVDLPKGSNLGDSLYVNVFNVFNNHQTMQYRWAGGVRGRHSWVPTRFISVGVSSAF